MTAKEYLKQVRKIDILINCKERRIKELFDSITSINSNLSASVVQGSKQHDQIGETVSKIIDLQKELNEDIDQLVSTKREIMKIVDQLDAPLCQLIYLRYFDFKTFEEIAIEMSYSYQWVTGVVNGKPGLHIQALNAVQKILDKT